MDAIKTSGHFICPQRNLGKPIAKPSYSEGYMLTHVWTSLCLVDGPISLIAVAPLMNVYLFKTLVSPRLMIKWITIYV